MTVIERTASRFVLQDRPWLAAMVGALFLGAGTFVIVTSDEDWFGGGFAAAGAFIILMFANVETVTFDRGAGRLTRRLRGLVRSRDTSHALSEISSVRVEASPSADPSRAYRIVLRMTPGKSEPLVSGYSSGKDDKEELAAEIRRFLGLPEAPDTPDPGFAEMVGMLFKPPDQER